jgi:hypothetical protein
MVAGLPLRVVVFGVAGAAGAALVASALLGLSGHRCADQAWGELQRVAERARLLASLAGGSVETELRLPSCVEQAAFDPSGRFTLRAAGELRQGHAGTPLALPNGSLAVGPGPHRLVLTTDGSAVQIVERQ